jgi:hypothetical protein
VIDYNFLSDFTGLYSSNTNGETYTAASYIHDWEFLNASTTTSLETTNLRHSSRYVLSLRNPISEAYTFQSPIIEIPNAVLEKDFVFHAMFYSTYPANVQIYLYNWDNDHESVTPITTQLSAGEWTACFSNVFKFEDENEPIAHARIRIVISEHNSQVVRFTMPHLVYDKPFLDNTYFTYGKKFFPDVYYEVDEQQSGPSFPFMKLWHSLTSVAEGAMKDYIKILPTEYDELSVGLKNQIDSPVYNQFQSSLTNPDVMDENYMPWASMFIGSLIKNGIFVSPSLAQQTVLTTYEIGDTGPAGGNIFITPSTAGNSTGKYFEAAPVSGYVTRTWATAVNSNRISAVAGAEGTAIGTGAQNTIDIVAQAGNVAASSAAAYASDYTYGGFSDWFLPSSDELNQMYLNRIAVGGFTTEIHWSSSEYSDNTARTQGFLNGNEYGTNFKSNTYYVRPARMFDAGTEEITVPAGAYQEVFQGGVDFSRKQISTRMYGMGAGTRAALKNAARAVIGEEAAVLVSPLWQGDEWSIMVRTLTASTPGVSGSGQSSSAVYYAMEPAKPAGYTLLHSTVDAITFFLDDNDFGVFDQSILG